MACEEHADPKGFATQFFCRMMCEMRGLAVALRPRGIGVLLLHPGGVRTRMGPPGGLTPEQSVRGLRRLIDDFQLSDSGRFVRYDGVELPW